MYKNTKLFLAASIFVKLHAKVRKSHPITSKSHEAKWVSDTYLLGRRMSYVKVGQPRKQIKYN
jgi:hypothetical protein